MANNRERVQVAVRIRPVTAADKGVDEIAVTKDGDNPTIVLSSAKGTTTRTYDHVITGGQEDVFNAIGAPMLDEAFNGYNVCVFAYGQTGSGKTHSILGDFSDVSETGVLAGSGPGLLPRICQSMLDRCESMQADEPSLTCTVKLSFIEVYMEAISDLLNVPKGVTRQDLINGRYKLPSLKTRVKQRSTDGKTEWDVEDLREITVLTVSKVMSLIAEGSKFRQVRDNGINADSSRSHSIITFTLTQTYDPPSPHLRDKVCKIRIVDLAGSERIDREACGKQVAAESITITQSLLTLGRCLNICAQSGGKTFPPVRESVLTKLLSEVFGGNTKAVMLATVSPSVKNIEETRSTLQYASNAMNITQHATIGRVQKMKDYAHLKEQYDELERMYQEECGRREEEEEQKLQALEKYEEAQREIEQLKEEIRRLKEQQLLSPSTRGSGEDQPSSPNKVPALNLKVMRQTSDTSLRKGYTSRSHTPRGQTAPRSFDGEPQRTQVVVSARNGGAASAVTMDRRGHTIRTMNWDDERTDETDEQALLQLKTELLKRLPEGNSRQPERRPPQQQSSTDAVTVTDSCEAVFTGHSLAVYCCAFSPDGRKIMSASRDTTVKVWDTLTGEERVTLSGHTGFVLACDFSPVGALAVSVSDDETGIIWNYNTGEKIHILKGTNGHTNKVYCCKFSPCGKYVATGACDNLLKMWRVETGTMVLSYSAHSGAVFSVDFSRPEDNLVVTAGEDMVLRLWEFKTSSQKGTLSGHHSTVWSCRFHPDGKKVISASMDKTLKLWSVEQQTCLRTFQGHTHPIHMATFAKKGELVVSASRDKSVRVWNTETGELVKYILGHTHSVYHCAVHGRVILSCSSDKTLRLWKISDSTQQ